MKTKDQETSAAKGGSVQRKLLTREEVSKVLGVTYQRVCQLHRQGKLRPIENREASSGPNRGFVYRREDVERLRDTRHGASGSIAAAAFEINYIFLPKRRCCFKRHTWRRRMTC
jgi:hypothetical protein